MDQQIITRINLLESAIQENFSNIKVSSISDNEKCKEYAKLIKRYTEEGKKIRLLNNFYIEVFVPIEQFDENIIPEDVQHKIKDHLFKSKQIKTLSISQKIILLMIRF
jgi:hypothetical protein